MLVFMNRLKDNKYIRLMQLRFEIVINIRITITFLNVNIMKKHRIILRLKI